MFCERSEDFHWDRASCIEFTSHTIIREDTDGNDIRFQDNERLPELYNNFGSKGGR